MSVTLNYRLIFKGLLGCQVMNMFRVVNDAASSLMIASAFAPIVARLLIAIVASVLAGRQADREKFGVNIWEKVDEGR